MNEVLLGWKSDTSRNWSDRSPDDKRSSRSLYGMVSERPPKQARVLLTTLQTSLLLAREHAERPKDRHG